jgi:Glycosyl transferases group 1
VILGDGPDAEVTSRLVRDPGLGDAVEMPGRVPPERVAAEIARASCLLHPSKREGYGMVVVEAAALGTPSIVVAGSENAATELIVPGVNGFVAHSADPSDPAAAVVEASGRVGAAGEHPGLIRAQPRCPLDRRLAGEGRGLLPLRPGALVARRGLPRRPLPAEQPGALAPSGEQPLAQAPVPE